MSVSREHSGRLPGVWRVRRQQKSRKRPGPEHADSASQAGWTKAKGQDLFAVHVPCRTASLVDVDRAMTADMADAIARHAAKLRACRSRGHEVEGARRRDPVGCQTHPSGGKIDGNMPARDLSTLRVVARER